MCDLLATGLGYEAKLLVAREHVFELVGHAVPHVLHVLNSCFNVTLVLSPALSSNICSALALNDKPGRWPSCQRALQQKGLSSVLRTHVKCWAW